MVALHTEEQGVHAIVTCMQVVGEGSTTVARMLCHDTTESLRQVVAAHSTSGGGMCMGWGVADALTHVCCTGVRCSRLQLEGFGRLYATTQAQAPRAQARAPRAQAKAPRAQASCNPEARSPSW